ncbi:MAG: hypothetical protein M1823_004525, partial [Watsoniomyces obsoletus]
MGRHVSREDRVRVKALAESGQLASDIADQMDIPPSTVYRVLKAPLTPKKGRGRKPLYDTPK